MSKKKRATLHAPRSGDKEFGITVTHAPHPEGGVGIEIDYDDVPHDHQLAFARKLVDVINAHWDSVPDPEITCSECSFTYTGEFCGRCYE